jgi:hypothetical protein
MDFDQMLETWRAQNMAPPYEVNREALRQAREAEEARLLAALRVRRRTFWFVGLIGTAMAVWAVFWIAITITNGWPAIYAIAAGVSACLFALGVGAMWVSRGQEPERNFGNTVEEEVRRSLALVDYQLSDTRRLVMFMLGAACISMTTLLFSWTLTRSQDIRISPFFGYGWTIFVLAIVFGQASRSMRTAMRKAKPTLEVRQRRLRELLAALDARE